MVHIRWADAPSQRDRGPQDAPPIGEGSSALAVANAQRVVQRVSTELSLSLSDKRHSLDACFRLFGSRAGMTQPLMLSCSSMTKRNETKRNETKRTAVLRKCALRVHVRHNAQPDRRSVRRWCWARFWSFWLILA